MGEQPQSFRCEIVIERRRDEFGVKDIKERNNRTFRKNSGRSVELSLPLTPAKPPLCAVPAAAILPTDIPGRTL